MCRDIAGRSTRPQSTHYWSIDGHASLCVATSQFWSEIFAGKGSIILNKCCSTGVIDSPSIHTQSVLCISWWHTTQALLPPTCQGPPQGNLIGPSRVIPGIFDHESTLIHFINPSTIFHAFPIPKSQSNRLRHTFTSLN